MERNFFLFVSFTDRQWNNSLFYAPDLLSYADQELTNSVKLASDWLTNISVCDLVWQRDSSHFTNSWS